MSWLKNHMRHFVIPGIQTIVRDRGRSKGQLTAADIKQSDKKVRPSQKCKYVEAGMLYSVVSSILPTSNVTREIALGLCREIGRGGDGEFVNALDLGGRGVYTGRVRELADGYDGVEGSDVLHSFITNSVKALKKRTGRRATVIYPGRDVWCWEVMSRKLGMPSLYDPRVSRSIATNEEALKKVMKDWKVPNWERTVLFDSGYAGTVPRAIGKAAGLASGRNVVMLSAVNPKEQIFPNHTKARKKALACEYLAKYRKRSVIQDGEAYQTLAGLDEFIKAALLTIWLWHHVSPAKLPSWKDPAKRPWKRPKGWSKADILNINPTTLGNYSIASTASTAVGFPINNNVSILTGTSTGGSNITFNTTGATASLSGLWGVNASTSQNTFTPVTAAAQPYILDPNTFQLIDQGTMLPAPIAGNGPIGPTHPTQGYQLGQYPGPKLVKYAGRPIDKSTVTRAVIDNNGFVDKKLPTKKTQLKVVPIPPVGSLLADSDAAAKLRLATKRLDKAKKMEATAKRIMNTLHNTPTGTLPDVSLRINQKANGDFVKETLLRSPLVPKAPLQNGSGNGAPV